MLTCQKLLPLDVRYADALATGTRLPKCITRERERAQEAAHHIAEQFLYARITIEGTKGFTAWGARLGNGISALPRLI